MAQKRARDADGGGWLKRRTDPEEGPSWTMKETTRTLIVKGQAWELPRELREEQLNGEVRRQQS